MRVAFYRGYKAYAAADAPAPADTGRGPFFWLLVGGAVFVAWNVLTGRADRALRG